MSNKTYLFLCPNCAGRKLIIFGDITVSHDAEDISTDDGKIVINGGRTMSVLMDTYIPLFYRCADCETTWREEDDLIAAKAIADHMGYPVDGEGNLLPTADDYDGEDEI